MPKQDGGSPGFLTPVVRTCLLVGAAMGLLLGLYLGLGVPRDEAANVAITRVAPGNVVALVVGLGAAGAVLGTVAGVVVERGFSDKDSPDKKKKWWRGGKSSRSRR
jgi:hypothetical protein